jgi:decaprenylphospho-beta-D-ribofuranose 2-oxidase
MPPAEGLVQRAPPTPEPARVHGWAGGAGASVLRLRPRSVDELQAAVELARGRTGALPRGMGRSYGDAAQLAGGLVLDTTALKHFELHPARGVVTAQAGVTIGELLERCVPAGWMVPVVPGTQHVSVGGAIASDIHGKSHGVAGTFSRHVQALGLLTAAGEMLELGPPDPLFQATVGGMGLTGVIVWARIELLPVSSPLLAVDTDRVSGLEEALELLAGPGGPYRVAWLDLLGPVRGVVTRAEHIAAGGPPAPRRAAATVRSRITVPPRFPSFVLRPETVRAFNALRFWRSPRRARGHPEAIGPHMFPLDALEAWPRLYGRRGFYQYQLVVPRGAERVLLTVIEVLRDRRVPCYLAVLKDFGPANAAPLSFPIEGWTLALDLPRAVTGLDAALQRCDELVAGAGGRVYLSKDARLRPEVVRSMYPRLSEWQAIRERVDPERVWRSDLALRTGLVS